ncbi:hypothetical protein BZG36_03406 [Bifiguratus adelaidae]|uniref:Gal80p-like C-terminal domain-containing protein n=1 Tax=Bifiguratus adelaidae TaxID=1938954 RepID=A0A261Y0E3_9FUNG|nr:hypothetical protein BZG36_03406 [Bifiguratus adelaidae]
MKSTSASPSITTGLVNTSLESGQKSKEANGLVIACPYDSVDAMLAEKDGTWDIFTIVVSVLVPADYSLIKPALEAGKDVMTQEQGVKTAVVPQARKAPPIIKPKQLVESGAIGRIISTNLKNGANLMSIVGGHDLEALAYVLGEFETLNTMLKTAFPMVDLMVKTGKQNHRDIVDQVLVQGVLKSGAVASIDIRGEQPSDVTPEGLCWEIHGSQGDIVITSHSVYSELSKLSIKLFDWMMMGIAQVCRI